MTSPARRGFVDTSRGQLHYRRQGSGAPIVMLQILPFTTEMFRPLMAELAATGFDCVALDLMGYGHSDRRNEVWRVEDHAETLAEALVALDVRPACLVSGHFTAMVASEFAIRHPDRVERLLLDGVPLWPRLVAKERLAQPRPLSVWTANGEEIGALWASVIALLQKFDPELLITEATTPLAAEAFFGFAATALAPGSTEAIFQYDLESRLGALGTPTLVVASPTDSLRNRHETAMALIDNARQHVFEEVHPLYPLDRPERAAVYAAVIRDFVRG